MSASALELEKLMVRLVADATAYDRTLDAAAKKLDAFVARVEATAKKLSVAVGGLTNVMGNAAKQQFAQMSAGLSGITSAANSLTPALSGVQKSTQAVGQAAATMASHVVTANRALSQSWADIENSGRKMMMLFTLPLAGAGVMGLKQWGAFEEGLTRAGMAANLSGKQMDEMHQSALSMSKELGMSATAIAGTFGGLLRGGLEFRDVLDDAGKSAAMLARVGEVSTEIAGNTIVKILTVFKKDGLDAALAVDTLSAAADSSVINIRDMILSISQGGAMAAAAGQNFKDFSAAIAILGQAGIVASDAGTSMKVFFQRLTDQDGPKLLSQIGVEAIDAAGNIRPLRDIMDGLNRSLRTMSQAEGLERINKIFGTDAGRAALVLGGAGAEGLDAQKDKMEGMLTIAEKYDKLLDTLSGRWGRFLATLERFGLAVGTLLEPILLKVTAGIEGMIAAFQHLNPLGQTIVVWAGTVVAALFPVAYVLGSLGSMFGKGGTLLTAFSAIGTGVAFLTSKVLALIPTWAKLNALILAAQFNGVVASVRALGAAIVASVVAHPFIALASAVGLVAAAFVDWGKVFGSVVPGMKDELKEVRDLVRSFKIDDVAPDAQAAAINRALRVNAFAQDDASVAAIAAKEALAAHRALSGTPTGVARDFLDPLGSTEPALQAAVRETAEQLATLEQQEQQLIAALRNSRGEQKKTADEAAQVMLNAIQKEFGGNIPLNFNTKSDFEPDFKVPGSPIDMARFDRDREIDAMIGQPLTDSDFKRWEHLTDTIVARMEHGLFDMNAEQADKDRVKLAATMDEAARRPVEALEVGTQAAANAMLQAIAGKPNFNAEQQLQKQQLDVQKESKRALQRIEKNLKDTPVVRFAEIV